MSGKSDEEFSLESLSEHPILVVEDNPGAQTAIRLALRRRGLRRLYFEETIAGGIAAFDADPESWVCAILDARLPDGSGLTVARHIADRNPTCGLVVLTARWDDAVVNEALSVPVHAFGHKPFDVAGPAVLVHSAVAKARGVIVTHGAAHDAVLSEVAGGMPRALTPKQRYIVAMRIADRSYAEIGESLDISVETVRSHLKHARSRMGGQPGQDLSELVEAAAQREFAEKVG